MKIRERFVVIEGSDGSGKSSVAEHLSASGRAHYFETPGLPFSRIKDEVIEDGCALTNGLFFMASVLDVRRHLETIATETTVVCVRYIWSTIAYQVARGLAPDLAKACWLAVSSSIIMPEKVIMLHVDDDERRRRLINRREPPVQTGLGRSLAFSRRLTAAYEFALECVPPPHLNVIDTSRLPIVDVVKQVEQCMRHGEDDA
jgi:thymidylate kinase